MRGNKLIALSWWTFAYLIGALALFAFSSMGDCLQGSEGAACRTQSKTFSNGLILVACVVYAALTWLMCFRRR